MKKKCFRIVLALISLVYQSCNSTPSKNDSNFEKILYNSSSRDSIIRGHTINGKLDGLVFVEDYLNTKCEEIEFENGIKQGMYKSFMCTKNHKILESTGFYKANLKDSVWITFTESGDTLSITNYTKDIKNGYEIKKIPDLKSKLISRWVTGKLSSSVLVNDSNKTYIKLCVNGSGYLLEMPFTGEKEILWYEYKVGVKNGIVRGVKNNGDTTMFGQTSNNYLDGPFAFYYPLASVSAILLPSELLMAFKKCNADNLKPKIITGVFKQNKPVNRWSIYDESNYLIKVIIIKDGQYQVFPPDVIVKYTDVKARKGS